MSGRALALAIDVAKANHARLMILYAYVPIVPLVPEQYIDSSTWTRVDTETRRWIERQLSKLADRARKAGVRASAMIVTGDPAQRIVGIARSKRVDHRRRDARPARPSKFFLGSVAERVIATAPCPVLTVRGK